MPRLLEYFEADRAGLKTFNNCRGIVSTFLKFALQRGGISHDVMRHTFTSMFVAKFRSLGEAALQAGNSESIIRKHYFDLKTTEEAERFSGFCLGRRTLLNANRRHILGGGLMFFYTWRERERLFPGTAPERRSNEPEIAMAQTHMPVLPATKGAPGVGES